MRVNLHCHSTCSDGSLSPEEMARRLAEAGVAFAALTDHDTVDGLARFRAVLQRQGVGTVTGLELSAVWRGEDVHLLVYGFDAAQPELLEALRASRQARHASTQSVEGALRRAGADGGGRPGAAEPRPAAGGPLPVAEAIALAHRAGGKVFLAHPLYLRPEPPALRDLLAELRGCGLDGVEALYAPADPERCAALVRLADELGLLVCAGTDGHTLEDARRHGWFLEMPAERWQAFRDALHLQAATSSARAAAAYRHARRGRRRFSLHVMVPALLAVALFVVVIWVLLIPAFERALLDRKREMISELIHSAWSIMADAERQASDGRVSRAEAQAEARERIAALRYGHENKDYFWLQDLHPRMLMHPYRPDLIGQDLSTFRDARGVPIFVEIVEAVRRHRESYVDYVWQWPDDPRRLEPKESCVKLFEPWGWIVGTGLYIDDVRHEIARLERGLVQASLAITALVAWLLFHVVRYSRRLDRERSEAVDELHVTTERYRSLVEAATEGTLLVVDGRCRYANPHLLALLGYTAAELELLDLSEVLPTGGPNAAVWEAIERLRAGGESPTVNGAGVLRRRGGVDTACALALTRIAFGGRAGLVLMAREPGVLEPAEAADPLRLDARAEARAPELAACVDHVPVGLFLAAADPRGTVLAANAIAARCLRAAGAGGGALAEAFAGEGAFGAFLARARQDGTAECRLAASGQSSVFALRAAYARGESGGADTLYGLVEEVTSLVRREQERDAIIERLQSSLLFLHEPVSRVLKPGVFCPGDWAVSRVARLFGQQGVTAALVQDAGGATIGIVTASDLCARVVAAGRDAGQPVRQCMSAPVETVSARTPVYEALSRLHECRIRHLGVSSDDGALLGTVSDRDLLPFQQYGGMVLTSEISRASLVEDVVRSCRRTASTVQALLDSGVHARSVTRLISSVCDAATERFVHLAVEELGPPPARYVFVALGSQGRQDQTLVSDQDNAIIYEPPAEAGRTPEVAAYFLEMGKRVCGWLNEAGYPFCRGRFMAQNPVWTRPISAWKTHFSYWAARAEPEELLVFTVFFDFRAVCGEAALVDDLRRHVFDELRDAPAFFPHFAREALRFKPPVMVLGRVVMGGAAGGMLDLKAAVLPIVAFARLYALRYAVAQTNTLERLDALVEAGQLAPASRDEIAATYAFLTRLRLQHQAQGVQVGRAPDNLIEVRRLGYADRTLLRHAFAHIRALQRRIAYDFLGGTHM